MGRDASPEIGGVGDAEILTCVHDLVLPHRLLSDYGWHGRQGNLRWVGTAATSRVVPGSVGVSTVGTRTPRPLLPSSRSVAVIEIRYEAHRGSLTVGAGRESGHVVVSGANTCSAVPSRSRVRRSGR